MGTFGKPGRRCLGLIAARVCTGHVSRPRAVEVAADMESSGIGIVDVEPNLLYSTSHVAGHRHDDLDACPG